MTTVVWRNLKRLIPLLMATVLLVGCGSDDKDNNNVDDRARGGGTFNNNPHNPNTGGSVNTATLNQIESSHQCPQGAPRVKAHFTSQGVSGSQNLDNISAQFVPSNGSTNLGGQVRTFYGINTEIDYQYGPVNDIMVVRQFSNGNQVLGYNLEISLCGILGVDPGTRFVGLSNHKLIVNSNTSEGEGYIADSYMLLDIVRSNGQQQRIELIMTRPNINQFINNTNYNNQYPYNNNNNGYYNYQPSLY